MSHSSLTKVICTLGVKSRTVPELVALLEAGMNVARFDFSWGSMAYHTKTLANLREAMKQTKILCATMVDTRGSEIGVQLAPEDVTSFDAAAPKSQLVLEQGSRVTLTTDLSVAPSAAFLPVNNPDLVNFVSPGDDVFVGQYLFTGSESSSVYLKVDEVAAEFVIRDVIIGEDYSFLMDACAFVPRAAVSISAHSPFVCARRLSSLSVLGR